MRAVLDIHNLRLPRPRLSSERGILMVEVVIAMFIFAIVAAAIVDMLASSTTNTTRVKQQTLAEQGVTNQIEKIRAMNYDEIGTQNGCVPGPLSASTAFSGLNGETLGFPATMTTNVSYASANVPGSANTGADYKKITVTITRNQDGKVMAQAVTYVAPEDEPSQTTGTITANVNDYGSSSAVPGAQVNLGGGPSAPETCTTDASGKVTFPGLDPNPPSYTLSVPGYDELGTDTSSVLLSPTQRWSTVLNVYKPASISVTLQNPNGTAYNGTTAVPVVVTSNDARTSGKNGTFTYNNGSWSGSAGTTYTPNANAVTVTHLPTGDPDLVPGQYTISASPAGYVPVSAGPTTVPTGYPTNLTSNFVLTLIQLGELDVTVQMKYNGNWINCRNTNVTLSGGPAGLAGTTLTTSATGAPAKFTNLVPGGPAATWAPPLSTAPFTVKASSATVPLTTVTPVSVQDGRNGPTPLTIQAGTTLVSSC